MKQKSRIGIPKVTRTVRITIPPSAPRSSRLTEPIMSFVRPHYRKVKMRAFSRKPPVAAIDAKLVPSRFTDCYVIQSHSANKTYALNN